MKEKFLGQLWQKARAACPAPYKTVVKGAKVVLSVQPGAGGIRLLSITGPIDDETRDAILRAARAPQPGKFGPLGEEAVNVGGGRKRWIWHGDHPVAGEEG